MRKPSPRVFIRQKGHMSNGRSEIFFITEKSFKRLYDLYAKKLFQLCQYYLNDREEAREIVHDIFRSLWERREELEIRQSPEHYLTRSAKLKINRFFRDRAVQAKHLQRVGSGLVVSDNTTENMVLFEQLSEQITTILATLPFTTQRIFRLSREEGLGNREIASLLQLSEKSVEYHITKSLALLRSGLDQ
ncbi:RNA polymerase sigma-70 factor [Larkinella harenae]